MNETKNNSVKALKKQMALISLNLRMLLRQEKQLC